MASLLINQRIIIIITFAVILITGLLVVKDFGITTDEHSQQRYGEMTWKYVTKGEQRLLTYPDRYYGPAFEAALILAEKITFIKNKQKIFQLRHTLNFFSYFISLIFFFLLVSRQLKDWRWGLLGTIMLVLTPCIIGHAFYNSKDIPLLVFCIISMFTLFKFMETRTIKWTILHGLACAVAIDIRILGLLMAGITVVKYAGDFIFLDKMKFNKKKIFLFGLYIAVILIGIFAMWPAIWKNPLHEFIQAFLQMKKFHWDNEILYMGKYVRSTQLPWYYALVWMGITIPVTYIALFGAGIVKIIRDVFGALKQKTIDKYWENHSEVVLYVLWLLVPLAAVILGRSVLYSGWRHLYFVYPAFLLIALIGLKYLFEMLKTLSWKNIKLSNALIIFLVLELTASAFFMLKNHPFHTDYFNWLIGGIKSAYQKYEIDYWGLTYKPALEKLLNHEKEKEIYYYAPTFQARDNLDILSEDERSKLNFVKDKKYAQFHLEHYPFSKQNKKHLEVIDSITINELPVLQIYENKSWINEQEERLKIKELKNSSYFEKYPESVAQKNVESRIATLIRKYVRSKQYLKIQYKWNRKRAAQGYLDAIYLQGTDVILELGDVNLPLKSVNLVLHQVSLDFDRLGKQQFEAIEYKELEVSEIILTEDDLNTALKNGKGDLKKLTVDFVNQTMVLKWHGNPTGTLTIEVNIGGHEKTGSNFIVRVKKAKVAKIPLPTGILNFIIKKQEPLIRADKLHGKLRIGTLTIQDDSLIIGE